MSIKSLFGNRDSDKEEEKEPKLQPERLTGKIYHLSEEGFGFISSPAIKFTRIFFHWTGLEESTLKFTDLKKGMKVEFTPIEIEDKETGATKNRAIRVRVVD